jgi:hypothetical protein
MEAKFKEFQFVEVDGTATGYGNLVGLIKSVELSDILGQPYYHIQVYSGHTNTVYVAEKFVRETERIDINKPFINNGAVIERFSISVDNTRLPKIIFKSDEKTANAVKLALIINSSFWNDIQRDFHSFPIVKTTIYCKHKANIDNFLEINSVRSAFLNAL